MNIQVVWSNSGLKNWIEWYELSNILPALHALLFFFEISSRLKASIVSIDNYYNKLNREGVANTTGYCWLISQLARVGSFDEGWIVVFVKSCRVCEEGCLAWFCSSEYDVWFIDSLWASLVLLVAWYSFWIIEALLCE